MEYTYLVVFLEYLAHCNGVDDRVGDQVAAFLSEGNVLSDHLAFQPDNTLGETGC